MEGNVLWIEKDYDSWMYLGANESLRNLPINDGESFELEYEVYVEYYESRTDWAPLALMQVHLNTNTVNSNPDKYYDIRLWDGGRLTLVGPDRYVTYLKTDSFSKYDDPNVWIEKVHRIKIEVDKHNGTNFEVKYYVDGDLVGKWDTSFILSAPKDSYLSWKWKNFTLTEVCYGIGFVFGSTDPNNRFKMAIDNLRIKLPNGTVLYEDFEDNNWNRIFGRISYKRGYSDYGLGSAPKQSVKASIPWDVMIIAYSLITFIVLKRR